MYFILIFLININKQQLKKKKLDYKDFYSN